MPKTLVVGDLHGQWELAERALATNYPVIFLGDYVDSYNRTPEDSIKTLEIVLRAIKDGKAQGLLGNHELSYLLDSMRCSGFNPAIYMQIKYMEVTLLKDFIFAENFLLTHAGVSQYLLDKLDVTLDNYLADKDYYQIGYRRGGFHPCGGIYWCDWTEFDPVTGVNQIFGHSRNKEIRQKEYNFCIDCLEDTNPQGLLIKNGVAEIYTF